MNSISEAKKALESGMVNEGRDILLNIVDSDPDNESAWMLLCGISTRTDDWKLGAMCFKRMTELRPRSSIATSGLVQSYYNLGFYKDALAEIERFKEISDPSSDDVRVVRDEHEITAKEISKILDE